MSKEIDSVFQVISENYTDPVFNIASLAGKLGISSSYLREVVYASYQMSPQSLLETFRLEHAIKSIAKDNEVIDTIRLKAGYAYTKSFRRAFKKRVGMTPKECKDKFAEAESKEIELSKLLTRLHKTRNSVI